MAMYSTRPGAEQQRPASEDDQEADVDGVAYVPVRAAHDEAWRRHLRDRRPPRPDELDERTDDGHQACSNENPASHTGDGPGLHGRVEMPVAEHLGKQAAEGTAES